MSVNSSFNSSTSSSDFLHHCFESRSSIFIFASFTVVNIFLIPLFILVLYLGYQRWRKQRRGSTAAMTSHSDVFTYNVVALELTSILGCCFYFLGALLNVRSITSVGTGMFSFTSPGQTMFHVLTCVERYLAVVHPVTYLGLRQAGGVRNVSIGCVWLLGFATLTLTKVLSRSLIFITESCLLVFFLFLVLFCNLSVLHVLIRPGPGEGDGSRERVDQTKQRAFHTITAIMGALFLRLVGILVSDVIYSSTLTHASCAGASSVIWMTLPCSLVLPLLFLHRAGKLPGCKHRT